MSQHATSGPSRDSEIPRGSKTLKRTLEIRESLKTTKTRRLPDGTVCLDLRTTAFFRLSDAKALAMFGSAFGPELDHLKNAKASVEATSAGAIGLDGLSPSRSLFGVDYIEVNRTLVGVLALKWIVNDQYDVFSGFQPAADRLTRSSWDDLRRLFEQHLRSDGEVYALLVATIVNDLGKDPALVRDISARHLPAGSADPNHDEVIRLAAQHGEIELLNEFELATPALHADLMTGLTLGSTLNIGQLAQAENVPGSLRVVRDLRPKPHAFALKYLEILLDVAGAQGASDARGATLFTEFLFGTYQHARQAVDLLIADPETSLRTAYDCVLKERSAVVRASGFDPTDLRLRVRTGSEEPPPPLSLDPADPTGRAFLRLLCITRSFNAQQADRVAAAYTSLSAGARNKLVDGLAVDGDNDGLAILPYYAPALFSNASRVVTQEKVRVRAFAAVMRLLAKVFRGTRPQPNTPGRVVECDLSVAQKATKGDRSDPIGKRFAEDPDALDDLDVPLTQYSEEL